MSDRHQADDFEEIEALLGELATEDIELLELPDDLWDGIRAETTGATKTTVTPVTPQPEANVVSLDARRNSRLAPILAAAAAVVVIAGALTVLINRSDDSTVLASADLAYEEGFDPLGATADASVLLVEADGSTVIRIDESTLPDTSDESEDLELWLIEPDSSGAVSDLVSLGLIDRENPGEFNVPDGFDPDVYFVVDISIEPRDGDENHSGRSILRGPLSDA